MRLARSRKIVLLGVILLAAGLAGRASADTTKDHQAKAQHPVTALPATSASAPANITKSEIRSEP